MVFEIKPVNGIFSGYQYPLGFPNCERTGRSLPWKEFTEEGFLYLILIMSMRRNPQTWTWFSVFSVSSSVSVVAGRWGSSLGKDLAFD